MKALFIVLTLLMTGSAFAETDHDIRVNRIEMTEVAPDESNDSKATDHNSSRSNKTSSNVAADRETGADDSETSATEATDYNSSRSNKADNAVSDEDSDDNAPAEKPKS